MNSGLHKCPALLFLTIFLVGCSPRVTINRFIVPQGYEGVIAVVSNPEFTMASYRDSGEYVHPVPVTAVVCVNNARMFHPFLATAEYTDGAEIYSRAMGFPSPPDDSAVRIEAIGAWGGSSDDHVVIWFGVVVNRHESEEFEQFAPYCGARQ